GELPTVMEKLADYIEPRAALRAKGMTAFVYPAVVTFVAIAIVIFLLSYVVPQVVGAVTQTQKALPLLTRIMLWASGYVREWGTATSAALLVAFIAWRWYLRRPAARLAWHARLLSVPIAGGFVLGVNTARYASTLAILTSSGIPL